MQNKEKLKHKIQILKRYTKIFKNLNNEIKNNEFKKKIESKLNNFYRNIQNEESEEYYNEIKSFLHLCTIKTPN